MAKNEKLAALSNKIPAKLTPGEIENYREQIEERDNTMVTGIFRNLEKPGQTVKDIPYRVHGKKGTPIQFFTLRDGCVETIPYGLAFRLENECHKIQYKRGLTVPGSNRMSSEGIAMGAASQGMEGGGMHTESYIPRYSFLSTDVPQRPGLNNINSSIRR